MSTIHIVTNSLGSNDHLVVYETEAGEAMYDGTNRIGPTRLHKLLNEAIGIYDECELHELTDEQMGNWEEEIYK